MSNEPQQTDVLNWDEKSNKLPGMINVLTILTYIGCGLGLITAIYSFLNAQKTYDDMPDALAKLENAPAFAKKMMGPDPLEFARRSLDNKLPILLLSLVACALCFYGALQMRNRKKAGFSIYAIGEVLPIVAIAIFLGLGLLGSVALISTFLFPVLFLILYATQLKHLS